MAFGKLLMTLKLKLHIISRAKSRENCLKRYLSIFKQRRIKDFPELESPTLQGVGAPTHEKFCHYAWNTEKICKIGHLVSCQILQELRKDTISDLFWFGSVNKNSSLLQSFIKPEISQSLILSLVTTISTNQNVEISQTLWIVMRFAKEKSI